MAGTAGVTAAAAPKSYTKTAKPKSPRHYPSFYEMISDAIVTLKEKTGSSQYAITRFLEEKHKKKLPSNFRKLLLVQLKKLVASDKLVKVKNSFKLPPSRSIAVKKPAAEKLKVAKSKPRTAKDVAKPKPKTTKAAAAVKPTPKTSVKAKPAAKKRTAKAAVKPRPKPKTVAKPAKVAKTAAISSPGKKVSKPKRAAPVKSVKKPKSVKSPASKKTAAKKAKK